jgi:focal adhesion kinase 2
MVVVPVDVEKEDVRILKVCFYSNSFNPGKNFKLVKCTVQTEVRVSVEASVLSVCLFFPVLPGELSNYFSA